MPTTLGQDYSIDWRGRPPHMLRPDVPVWYKFLDQWGFQFTTLFYDCLLGGPTLTPEQLTDPLKRMWRANIAKRADAIATTKSELWIIEVAADPGLRAIGQLMVYHTLWLRDPVIEMPERMVLVCDRIDPDLLDACGMHSVLVFVNAAIP